MRVHVLANKMNFDYRVPESTKKCMQLLVATSIGNGAYKVKIGDNIVFRILNYANVLTCMHLLSTHDHRQASSWVIGNLLQLKFQDVSCRYRPRDIIREMRTDLSINMAYCRVYRAREEASNIVRGSPEES